MCHMCIRRACMQPTSGVTPVPLSLPTSTKDVMGIAKAAPVSDGMSYWHDIANMTESMVGAMAVLTPRPEPTSFPSVTPPPPPPPTRPPVTTRPPPPPTRPLPPQETWQCMSRDGKPQKPAKINWGYQEKDATWACNQWIPSCAGSSCKASPLSPDAYLKIISTPMTTTMTPQVATTPSLQAPTTAAQGPHTGRLIASLPVSELSKPNGGVWNAKIKFKKGGIETFQGVPVIKAFYKKGSGTGSMPNHDSSGLSIDAQPVGFKGTKGIVVAFDVMFDGQRWEWSKGGKLGGIFIGTGKASGGRKSTDGASHRIMWKADGGAISYIYPPAGLPQTNPGFKGNPTFGYGLHLDTFKGVLKKGQWNHIEIGVKLNSFVNGKPAGDGKAVLTVNGKTAVTDNINWAKSPDILIDSFEYSTFFGGPDPATVDSVTYAKNFAVYEWKG